MSVLLSGCATAAPSAEPSACDGVASRGGEGEYRLAGAVTYSGVPSGDAIPDVHITVAGDGFSSDVCSDEDGRWEVMAPRVDSYLVTLDPETIPEGAVLDAEAIPEGAVLVDDAPPTFTVEPGLTDTKVVNTFLEG
ncbi:hypothetical protein [Mycolicibacterium sp.]|uniref:hypothetical protein n=1 Tax=Mycolicibacterium sp. TaxID=2320850 RepID=UPI0037C8510D